MFGSGVVVDPDRWHEFEAGWRCPAGSALCVVAPRNVEELRSVVRRCVADRLTMVPQGALTGLVGAGVPDDVATMVVVSTYRLKAIRHFSSCDGIIIAESGARLSDINALGQPHGLMLGIDLGADPSIGGMVSTNTGGSRLVRYGGMRQHLLGTQVVLADADATLITHLPKVRKDNSRIGWSQLVAGAGGAFGFISAASIALDPVPVQQATALIALESLGALPALIGRLRKECGELLTACEGMSANAVEAVVRHRNDIRQPFSSGVSNYMVLIELSTSIGTDFLDLDALLHSKLASILEDAALAIVDIVAMHPEKAWALRHAISAALVRDGEVIGLDISLPLEQLPEFRERWKAKLAAEVPWTILCDFGHCGDGGLHFNLVCLDSGMSSEQSLKIRHIREMISSEVSALGGSFSAEHGLGPANAEIYSALTPVREQQFVSAIKSLIDPHKLLSRALPA
jgi:FAD/FMN-containing dehydrogenase